MPPGPRQLADLDALVFPARTLLRKGSARPPRCGSRRFQAAAVTQRRLRSAPGNRDRVHDRLACARPKPAQLLEGVVRRIGVERSSRTWLSGTKLDENSNGPVPDVST